MKHTCHWATCRQEVPPKLWGCKKHWFKLPKRLRDAVWRTYSPGQENRKDPSQEYLDVTDEIDQWAKENPDI